MAFQPRKTHALKTPETVEEEFIQLSGSAESLSLSFDMEDCSTTTNPFSSSEKKDGIYRQTEQTSSHEDIASFVNMMQSNSDLVKHEAASALLHVLSINHVRTAVECGAIPVLLDTLMKSSKQSVRDKCVKCIGVIVKFSSQYRDHVVQLGGLNHLLGSLKGASSDSSLRTLLHTLSEFFNHPSRPSLEHINNSFLPSIVEFLDGEKEASVLVAFCKILSHLADGSPPAVRALMEFGTKQRLMKLMTHENENVVASALRTCRYLVSPPTENAVPQNVTLSPIRLSSYIASAVPDDEWKSPIVSKPAQSKDIHHHPPQVAVSRTILHQDPSSTRVQNKKECDFVPVRRGVWQCFLCLSDHCSIPSSFWKADSPPSNTFLDSHSRECPAGGNGNEHKDLPLPFSPRYANRKQPSPAIRYTGALIDSGSSTNQSATKDCYLRPFKSEDKLTTSVTGGSQYEKIPSQTTTTPRSNVAVDECTFDEVFTSSSRTSSSLIVLEDDKKLLTKHAVLVFQQLEICYLDMDKEKAGTSSRSGFPAGFPGVQCKHCAGTKNCRRFFWSSPDRFKNNSSEFGKHLVKCKHCPEEIKNQLAHLKTLHNSEMKELPRGSQITFFRRLFKRLHNSKATKDSILGSTKARKLSEDHSSLQLSYTTGTHGATCLGISEDSDWLDSKECFLRQNIEVFAATCEDIDTISSFYTNQRVFPGQAGLRCLHCSKKSPHRGLSDQNAFKFLTNIDDIRDESIAIQHHLVHCPYAPDGYNDIFKHPLSKNLFRMLRDYYKSAACKRGLYQGNNIVRLADHNDRAQNNDITASLSIIHSYPKENVEPVPCNESQQKDSTATFNAVTPSYSGTKRTFAMV